MKTRTYTSDTARIALWLLPVVTLILPATSKAQQASYSPIAQAAVAVTPVATVQPTQPQPAQVAAQPAQVQQVAAPAVPAGDPYGFTNWLNSTRAAYGLPAVGYDPNLSGWAHMNNTHQNAYGMGHHVMGPARRQNSAMGDFGSVPGMWMASPAHRAALLDPTIRWIGIAGLGAYWTFNAY